MMSARAGFSPGTVCRSAGRQAAEIVDDVLELGARDDGPMNRVRSLNPLPGLNHAGEVRERPARADDLRAAPVARGEFMHRARFAVAAERSSRFARGVIPLREYFSVRRIAPNGSEISRSISPSALSASSSEPPPMSITTARPTQDRSEPVRSGKRGAASSSPSRTSTLSPVSLTTRASHRPPIGRVAHRARCDDFVRLRAELSASAAILRARCDRVSLASSLSPPVSLNSRAESRRGFHLVDDADGAVRRDIGDDLADRIRADVDRRDARLHRWHATKLQ